MTKKRGLPFWLGLVLAMVLVVLLLLVAMAPKPERSTSHLSEPTASISLSDGHVTTHAATQQPAKATAPKALKHAPILPPQPSLPQPAARRGLSLILDDVGYNISALKRILALSVPVAISVLPDAPYAGQAARLAHEAGQVVMLHLPMQPIDPSLPMSNAFLIEGMTKTVLHDTFLHDIDQVPYAEGVNNHMGSKLTQLESPMHQVMQICRQKGLFFVDSRTTGNSVAAHVAKSMGLKWATRQLFLDHVMTPEYMQQTWEKARACVKKGRRCIIIAHPRAASVAFLESHLTQEDASHMVSIKQLLRHSRHQPVQLSALHSQ